MTGHDYILPDKDTEKKDLKKKPPLTEDQLGSELASPLDQKPPKDPLTQLVQRMVTEHRQELYEVGDVYRQERAESKVMDSQ